MSGTYKTVAGIGSTMTAMSAHSRSGPYLYLLITMVLFGTAFTGSKVVVGEVPHDVAAMLRFGGAAVFLVLLLGLSRDGSRFRWRDLVVVGGAGLIGIFAYNFFFFWGLTLSPAVDGSLIVPVFSPVLTTVALLVSGRETASALRITGLLTGVAGAVVFFVGISVGGVSGARVGGDLLYVLAAACWAVYSIISKKVLRGMAPLRATTYATGVGALALAVAAIPSLSTTDWAGVRPSTWAIVAFLAIGPTAIAYLFYFRALRSVGPVTATISMFTVPVFGTVSSVVFLGESFTAIQAIGALITIAGALLAVLQGSGKARQSTADSGGSGLAPAGERASSTSMT
jgi:drug/metabolite transporter (DMT)-like permease